MSEPKYRMEITRIDEAGDETTELLIEGSKAIVRASLSFAPAALGDEPASVMQGAPVNATSSFMTPDGPVVGDDKPRRPRRTKAQMEADRAAEQAVAEPVTAAPGEETTAPLATPLLYGAAAALGGAGAYDPPAAVEPAVAPYNPFAPAS